MIACEAQPLFEAATGRYHPPMTYVVAALALGAALVLPLKWGLWGFFAAASAIFALQVGVNFVAGFAGASLEESLLLFNGSWASYFGYNLQITYRAFALPLLALAAPLIFRLSRARS